MGFHASDSGSWAAVEDVHASSGGSWTEADEVYGAEETSPGNFDWALVWERANPAPDPQEDEEVTIVTSDPLNGYFDIEVTDFSTTDNNNYDREWEVEEQVSTANHVFGSTSPTTLIEDYGSRGGDLDVSSGSFRARSRYVESGEDPGEWTDWSNTINN